MTATTAKAKPTAYTHTTATGEVETRKSLRPYTHVVVGRRNLAGERAELVAYYSKANTEKGDFEFYTTRAAMKAGDVFTFTGRAPLSVVMTQKDVDEANAHLDKYGRTHEAYRAGKLASRLAMVNERHGEVDLGPEIVLQWSMSATNAAKGCSTWANRGWVGVHVEAVNGGNR